MKLNLRKEKSPSRKTAPEKPDKEPIGSAKACFYIGDSLRLLAKVNKKLKEAGQKKLSQSFVFREGAKIYLRRINIDVTKALEGRLHAKRRKD